LKVKTSDSIALRSARLSVRLALPLLWLDDIPGSMRKVR
jgi:hypothetical protein